MATSFDAYKAAPSIGIPASQVSATLDAALARGIADADAGRVKPLAAVAER